VYNEIVNLIAIETRNA